MTPRMPLFPRKPNKLFLLYFASIFIVIVIPVFLLSLSSYRLVVTTVQEELIQGNLNAISQTGASAERFLTEVNTLSIQLGLDGRIYAAAKQRENSYLLNDVKDRIISLASENMYVHSIQLYFHESGQIYSSAGPSRAYSGEPFDAWIDKIEEAGSNELWIPTRTFVDEDGNAFDIVTLVRKVPVAFPETLGYVAIHVYAEHLAGILQTLDLRQRSGVFLIDGDSNTVAFSLRSSAESLPPAPAIAKTALSANGEGYAVDGGAHPESLYAYGAPLSNGWVLLSETSLAYLHQKLAYVRQVIAATGAVLLLLGAAVAYYLSRTMFNPIQQLLEKSKRVQKELALPADEPEENALRYVAGLFDNVVGKHKALEASYLANRQAMIDRFIFNVLYNRAGNAFDLDEKIGFLRLPISNRRCAVILVEIDDYYRLADAYSTEDMNLFRFALANVAQEVAGASYPNVTTELNDRQIALIAHIPPEANDSDDAFRSTAQRIVDTARDLFRFSVTVAVGDPAEHILQAHRSFEQASEAAMRKLLRGPGLVHLYRDRPAADDAGAVTRYNYPEQLERNILNNAMAGHEDNVLMYLRQLREDISLQSALSRDQVYRVYHRLLDAASVLLNAARLTNDQVFGSGFSLHRELEKHDTVDAIHGWIESAFLDMTRALQSAAKSNANVDAAVRFIEEHFAEDLSVERIADAVGLNPAYVSRIFKQETGRTILEYLTLRRIHESKRLLTTTKSNLQDVAQSVGYNNINSFIRFFRKYEGITPGEYRKARSAE